MKIQYDGQDLEFDDQDITLQQAMVVQLHTGMAIADWQDSLDLDEDEDGKLRNPPPEWLKSVQCLYWLVMAQNGHTAPIADADFKFAKFLSAYGEAVKAEAASKPPEQPDPTKGTQSPVPSPEPSPPPENPPLGEEVAATGF